MSSSAVSPEGSKQDPHLDFEEEAPRGGVLTARLGALVPLIVGVFGVAVSAGLGIGSPQAPGPGLWPLVISLVMIVASVISLLKAKQDNDVEAFDRGTATVAFSVVSLLVYATLLPMIGFEFPTMLLLIFWIKILGKESWRSAILVSLVATVAVYALFILLLTVPLPHLF